MCDGWTGPTKLSIINFMVYSKGSTIFLKFVDASNNMKDNKCIYALLKDVIKEVGKQNVVQIVTDNGSAFVKVRKLKIFVINLLYVAHVFFSPKAWRYSSIIRKVWSWIEISVNTNILVLGFYEYIENIGGYFSTNIGETKIIQNWWECLEKSKEW